MKSLFVAAILALSSIVTAASYAADAPAHESGVRVFVHHEVADYAAWRKAYDAFAPTQRKMGVVAQSVYQTVDNPNDVVVTHDFASAAKAKAFLSSDELRNTMQKAGVKGAPQIWVTSRAAK